MIDDTSEEGLPRATMFSHTVTLDTVDPHAKHMTSTTSRVYISHGCL